MKQLEERLDQRRNEEKQDSDPVWRPEVGDRLIGEITSHEEVDTKYGKRDVLRVDGTAKSEDGNRKDMFTVFITTVLRSELKEKQPEIGDRIGIERLRDWKGKQYKRFAVEVEAQNGSPDQGSNGQAQTEQESEQVDPDIPF